MVELTTETVDTEAILADMEDHAAGGVVLFLGRVRDHAEGKQVQRMDYEAYSEMARLKLQEIEDLTRAKWPVRKMAIVHRTGTLELGQVSVAIAVACGHRGEAFEACRYAIDTLKQTVPIWKKEHFADGEAWVKGIQPTTKQQEGPSK